MSASKRIGGDLVNGAEALVATLEACGVTACFANPGTTELEIVAALDRSAGIRSVPVLFEGVAVGAADGFGRMSGIPGAALLHTGAGFPNGLSAVLNAAKASSPSIAIVGDHPLAIREWNHVIASGVDIERVAAPYAKWVRRSRLTTVGQDAADAFAAACSAPGGPATLVVPSDVAWSAGAEPGRPSAAQKPSPVSAEAVLQAAYALRLPGEAALVLHGEATVDPAALRAAADIAATTGCRVMARASRIVRGPDFLPVEFLPYSPMLAIEALKGIRHLVLVGAHPPIMPWTYPDRSAPMMADPECRIWTLARPEENVVDALTTLAAEIGGDRSRAAPQPAPGMAPVPASGTVTPDALAQSIAALIPENAIVIDESVTTGRSFYQVSAASRPHDWLRNLGGALGYGQPVAIGSAIACPDRKVIVLQGDGAAMYTPQSLWTIAHEGLNVLVVIFANRSYEVLRVDMRLRHQNVDGAVNHALTDLGTPAIDWAGLARSLGIRSARLDSMQAFNEAFAREAQTAEPALLEVIV